MTKLITDITDDPTFKQFRAFAMPLGGRERIDWSDCGLAQVGSSRRIPQADKTRGDRRAPKP